MYNIKILDPIHSKMDKKLAKIVKPAVSYESSYWKDGPYNKIEVKNSKCMVDGRSGLFLTGLIPRIKTFCKKNKIDLRIEDTQAKEEELYCKEPIVKGIEFRNYQIDAINSVYKKKRGVIKQATGSGKTVVGMGIASQYYPDYPILWVCHSTDLLYQTIDAFKKGGFTNIGQIGDGKKIKPKDFGDYPIIFAMVQTLSNYKSEDLDCFDILIIDEAHHVVDLESQYGRLIESLFAPIRVGFTATLPEKGQKLFTMEGLLGPVLADLTVKEAVEQGILTPPKVKLIPVPYSSRVDDRVSYKEVYKRGISQNRVRNRLLLKEIKKNIADNKSTLIMVQEIAHGEALEDLAARLNVPLTFIHGNTSKEERLRVKNDLGDKKILAVCCTSIWKEGIDIPSIDSFAIAMSGKSHITVIQGIGRALRKSEGKRMTLIIDFIDEARYLSNHFARRMKIYVENGWEILYGA